MKKLLFLIMTFFFAFQLTCFADINITNQNGTIKITSPDGTVVTVEAGQPIPPIADGSKIEIISGTVELSTTGTSTVNLVIDGNTVGVSAGTTLKFGLDSAGATTLSVTAGSVSLKTTDGKTVALDTGDGITVNKGPGGASTIQVITGTISITGLDGKTATYSPDNQPKAEPYTPPDIPGGQVDTQVQTEETARDISPVQ